MTKLIHGEQTDGTALGPIVSYRVSPAQFNFSASTLGVLPRTGAKALPWATSYYVLLEPLPKGDHIVRITGSFQFDAAEVLEFRPDAVDFAVDATLRLKAK